MAFYVVQFLTGLASAASLFLVASGLSIIFGVTRIVNFAHGAFYMLGAYVAFTLTERFSGAFGFWGGIVVAALVVAVVGVLVEMLLLRRIYHAPELFQLLATFGLTLMVEDLVVLIWGPDDLLGRRAPGFRGAVDFFGQNIPSYDLFLIVLGPLVLGALWLLFRRTRWGILVRAATQDRDMVAALGVNQKWLFTSVFALGVFLAALGGALQARTDGAPVAAAHRQRTARYDGRAGASGGRAADRRHLCAHRRRRDRDLRDPRRQSSFPDVGRRARLVRPRRLFRPRRLR